MGWRREQQIYNRGTVKEYGMGASETSAFRRPAPAIHNGSAGIGGA
jgi:hypothetical protein